MGQESHERLVLMNCVMCVILFDKKIRSWCGCGMVFPTSAYVLNFLAQFANLPSQHARYPSLHIRSVSRCLAISYRYLSVLSPAPSPPCLLFLAISPTSPPASNITPARLLSYQLAITP